MFLRECLLLVTKDFAEASGQHGHRNFLAPFFSGCREDGEEQRKEERPDTRKEVCTCVCRYFFVSW